MSLNGSNHRRVRDFFSSFFLFFFFNAAREEQTFLLTRYFVFHQLFRPFSLSFISYVLLSEISFLFFLIYTNI